MLLLIVPLKTLRVLLSNVSKMQTLSLKVPFKTLRVLLSTTLWFLKSCKMKNFDLIKFCCCTMQNFDLIKNFRKLAWKAGRSNCHLLHLHAGRLASLHGTLAGPTVIFCT